MSILADHLISARTAAGMSQEDLALKSGSTQASIWQYENDKSEPRFFTITCIADALGVSLDYLAGRDGSMDKVMKELNRLRTENKALRKDANRYRKDLLAIRKAVQEVAEL